MLDHSLVRLFCIMTCAGTLQACQSDVLDEDPIIVIELPDADHDTSDMSPAQEDMAPDPLDMSSEADLSDRKGDAKEDIEDMADMATDLGEEPEFVMPIIADQEVLEDLDPDPDVVEVNLRAELATIDVGNGIELDMMTYNGAVPGPLLQAKKGDTIIVHFTNALDEPTTVHWHGLRIPDDMDGSPRIQTPVEPGQSFTYTFVVPDAGTYWYHPHVRTNEQLEKGLYGPIVIHDPEDPEVDVERVIMVDDILLDETGIAPFFQGHMEAVHGRTGNTLLINGSSEVPITPPAKAGLVERWRLINPSNARTFVLGVPDTSFRIIATDGGVLPTPRVAERIEMAVGQRYELEVLTGKNAPHTLTAYIPTLNAQNEVVEGTFPLHTVTREALPIDLIQPEPRAWAGELVEDLPTTRQETYVFDGYTNAFNQLVWTINGEDHAMEPISVFDQGDVVAMTLENRQGPEHPFHLHGQFFTIVDDGFGRPQPGLRDTVLVPGRRTVKIIAYMTNPGMWMAHCHILEHAELGMMSEIEVRPALP